MHLILISSSPLTLASSLSLTYSLSSHLTGDRPLTLPACILLLYILQLTLTHSFQVSKPSQCAALHHLQHSTAYSFSLTSHTKSSVYILITLTIHSVHTTATSQVTHFNCLNLRHLTFISRPGLTCICYCRNYYAIPKRLLYFLTHCPFSHHAPQGSHYFPSF